MHFLPPKYVEVTNPVMFPSSDDERLVYCYPAHYEAARNAIDGRTKDLIKSLTEMRHEKGEVGSDIKNCLKHLVYPYKGAFVEFRRNAPDDHRVQMVEMNDYIKDGKWCGKVGPKDGPLEVECFADAPEASVDAHAERAALLVRRRTLNMRMAATENEIKVIARGVWHRTAEHLRAEVSEEIRDEIQSVLGLPGHMGEHIYDWTIWNNLVVCKFPDREPEIMLVLDIHRLDGGKGVRLDLHSVEDDNRYWCHVAHDDATQGVRACWPAGDVEEALNWLRSGKSDHQYLKCGPRRAD